MMTSADILSQFSTMLSKKVQEYYSALGLKPGEGGKFAPQAGAYDAAMRDAMQLLSGILRKA